METKDLVQMCLENLQKDKVLVEKAKALVAELIEGFVVINAELIVAIKDEEQFFAVIDGLLNRAFSNEKLEKDIKLPAMLEPFDGIVIEKYRGQVQGAILGFLNINVLDKVLGPAWFDIMKKKAADVVAGFKK